VAESQSMGSYLRAARRRRRVSIERAAEDTKIRADFLMRMESDEFDFLAAAYVRGFLRSYARYLRVDPEPLLAEFDRRFGFRADTAQILAAQRRSPSRRSRGYGLRSGPSSWQMAGIVAALILIALAIIGLQTPRERERRTDGGRVAGTETEASPSPEPSATPSPSPSPSPTPSPTDDGVIALEDGMEVTIDAVRGDCWVTVTADGAEVYTSTPSLTTGDSAGPFTAEESMSIVLGNAHAVDIVVNGKKIGPIGDEGEVVTVTLPDDIESL
jgi:cytoskeleton protein RodZ